MASAAKPAPGSDLLLELRDGIEVERLRATLRAFGAGGYEESLAWLRRASGGELDLGIASHRGALLTWLRAWGCRHLRVADTERSSEALAAWWERHGGDFPSATRSIADLTDRELDAAAGAYGALAPARAATRRRGSGRTTVSFGETAASKALFAIRPLAFPPWDAPMRASLGLSGRGGHGYRSYLEQAASALRGLARRLGVPVSGLPTLLGRPGSSPPKLIDEYLWVRTRDGTR